ncbi:MAG TPA: substrate-binding domain-containing protein [Thermoleophilaceae bacterium]|nr:substrate-binding domain-containing protein [Thermoleophilaceae bacterium]
MRMFLAVLAAIAALTVVACGDDDNGDSGSSGSGSGSETTASSETLCGERKIGIFVQTLQSTVLGTWTENTEQTLDAIGWTHETVEGAGDPVKSKQAMQTLLNQDVDAILTIAQDPAPIVDELQQAKEAGIPVYATFLETAPQGAELLTATLGDPSDKMGYKAADYVAKNLPDQPIIADNVSASYSGNDFVMAEKRRLAKYGLKFDDYRDISLTNLVESATQNATAMLQANPGEITYMGEGDFGPPIYQAVFDKLGRDDVTVLSRYDIEPTLELVRAGKKNVVQVTRTQDHMLNAVERLLKHWCNDEPLDTKDDLSLPGYTEITSENVTESGPTYPFEPVLEERLVEWQDEFGGN